MGAVLRVTGALTSTAHMRRFRKLCQRGSGSTLTLFFFSLVDGMERGIKIPLKEGHHRPPLRNTIKMAFCWHADNGLPLNAGLVAL